MNYSKAIKPLAIYIVTILVLAVLLNLFIRSYSKANYTEEKREELLSSFSKFRQKTDNPCTNFINGDPDAKENYVKIHIHCTGEVSSNTLALNAVHPPTYAGLINLIGKINSFETDVDSKMVKRLGGMVSEKTAWHCLINNEEILDFDKNIEPKNNINCYFR